MKITKGEQPESKSNLAKKNTQYKAIGVGAS
jgi:hypothetical protein